VRGWNLLLIALFAAVLGGSAWVLVTFDEDVVQAATGLVDLLVAIGAGMVASRGWLARRTRSATPEQRDTAVRWLADEMRLRLRNERRHRALMAPEPLAMRWRVRPPPFATAAGPDSASGRLDTGEGPGALLDWMSRVASRRAALIGQPGAGKTTLVTLVARELLERDRHDGAEPVPVIVSLADWDPRVDTLDRWISLRLSAQFPELKQRQHYGREAALSLVQHGQVFPILDGLDEIRDEFTLVAVEQVRKLPPTAPVIVTCRTETFERLTGDGRLAPRMGTIELEPLVSADVVAFLETAVDDRPSAEQRHWQRLIERVRSEPGAALTLALDTPLIAWLLWAAYVRGRRDPSPLLDRQRWT
jgi:GTPase SAR1 family protein